MNKYLRGKKPNYRNLAYQRSFFKTKILLHHCALLYSVHFWKSSRTNCPNCTANSQTSGTIFGLCLMADAKLNPCGGCQILIFLFFNQNICCRYMYFKEPVSWRQFVLGAYMNYQEHRNDILTLIHLCVDPCSEKHRFFIIHQEILTTRPPDKSG